MLLINTLSIFVISSNLRHFTVSMHRLWLEESWSSLLGLWTAPSVSSACCLVGGSVSSSSLSMSLSVSWGPSGVLPLTSGTTADGSLPSAVGIEEMSVLSRPDEICTVAGDLPQILLKK